MADIPLPGLVPTDPRNVLSEAARRRISNAYADAELIRTRALVTIEARYNSEPDSDSSFFEFHTTGQAAIELTEAKMQAARTVLSVVRDEFRATDKSGRELRQIMQDQLEGAVYSLELTTLQRDLLWQELGLYRYAEPNQQSAQAAKEVSTGAETEKQKTKSCARVDAFLSKVSNWVGHKITRTNFWTVAGYGDRTEFERFQRESRCTPSASFAFNRVLNMRPEDFIQVLGKKTSK